MEHTSKKPTLRAKWKKILKGTPTKQQVSQFMKDLQKQKEFSKTSTIAS